MNNLMQENTQNKSTDLPTVERWDIFELSCMGHQDQNPFLDYTIQGTFTSANESLTVQGFYDGNGVYKVRFMPSFEGVYQYSIHGSFSEDTIEGSFLVTAATVENHGRVSVSSQFHFTYDDGTSFYPIGTTCYVWALQSDERIDETLTSLKESGFNKIRFCIFPKHYPYNLGEPRSYPFEGTPMDSSVLTDDNFNDYNGDKGGNHWDFTRFNPKHFEHLETCIKSLCSLGIEADLILFHPYDRWGFSLMSREQDESYLRYLVARFSAFRNVWWSMANEYDLMPQKSLEDWRAYGELVLKEDPYNHLRGIHNCMKFYDHTESWITHCSLQRVDLYRTAENTDLWRKQYGKPIVLDEIAYEGNIQYGWGNITAQEMTRRFYEAAFRGGYPQHSETHLSSDSILWWSHGGRLKGDSWKRVNFLKQLLSEVPGTGLKLSDKSGWDEVCAVPEIKQNKQYLLYYYSFMQPAFRDFTLASDKSYEVEVIDTWNMTIDRIGIFSGRFKVQLPGYQYMAVRIKEV